MIYLVYLLSLMLAIYVLSTSLIAVFLYFFLIIVLFFLSGVLSFLREANEYNFHIYALKRFGQMGTLDEPRKMEKFLNKHDFSYEDEINKWSTLFHNSFDQIFWSYGQPTKAHTSSLKTFFHVYEQYYQDYLEYIHHLLRVNIYAFLFLIIATFLFARQPLSSAQSIIVHTYFIYSIGSLFFLVWRLFRNEKIASVNIFDQLSLNFLVDYLSLDAALKLLNQNRQILITREALVKNQGDYYVSFLEINGRMTDRYRCLKNILFQQSLDKEKTNYNYFLGITLAMLLLIMSRWMI